jgi:threonine/homoserine/homoserine lactone efflux protein
MKSLLAIVPSAGVLFLFWLAIRGMVTADRRERAALAKFDAEAAARPSAPPAHGDGVSPNG